MIASGLLWPVLLYLALFFATLHLVDRLASREPPGENEPMDAEGEA